jgi:hypothetical protein
VPGDESPITAWATGYNVPLAYDLRPESPPQDIGLRMPAENTRLGFNGNPYLLEDG